MLQHFRLQEIMDSLGCLYLQLEFPIKVANLTGVIKAPKIYLKSSWIMDLGLWSRGKQSTGAIEFRVTIWVFGIILCESISKWHYISFSHNLNWIGFTFFPLRWPYLWSWFDVDCPCLMGNSRFEGLFGQVMARRSTVFMEPCHCWALALMMSSKSHKRAWT